MKLVCFHLFNDYSGSPKVLHEVLSGLRQRGVDIELVTSRGGILDGLSSKGIKCRNYSYSFSANPVVTMLRYAWVQLLTFFMALRYTRNKNIIFYINTILPVGPAIVGKLTGKKVIYHYHENAFVKSRFYRTLASIMQRLADRIICVSRYQASFLRPSDKIDIVANAVNPDFAARLKPDPEAAFERKTVLMLSSLKVYKGTAEFIRLASALPHFHFVLVINDTREAIDKWLDDRHLAPPANLTIHPRTADVATFYNETSILLNLSDPALFIETFGLTAIEAMSCALPVIVPPKGGIAEMVEDGVNGYKIDCHNTERLSAAITEMLSNRDIYLSLAGNALSYSQKFNRDELYDAILKILSDA